jgi:hypothetical protein
MYVIKLRFHLFNSSTIKHLIKQIFINNKCNYKSKRTAHYPNETHHRPFKATVVERVSGRELIKEPGAWSTDRHT